MRRGINKIPIAKCFSCPGDSKELPKKTKGSTYDSNQARTKPRQPNSDKNSPITKRRTNGTPKCFSNLGDCSKEMEQGSSKLTIIMAVAYTRRV